jgi:hypothetical protein
MLPIQLSDLEIKKLRIEINQIISWASCNYFHIFTQNLFNNFLFINYICGLCASNPPNQKHLKVPCITRKRIFVSIVWALQMKRF